MGTEVILDIEAGIRTSGSKETYLSVLELTKKYANDKMINLESAYGSEDWERYETEVHSLKSSMASIGAFPLSELAKSHEMAVKDGVFSYIKETYEKLKDQFRSVLDEIQHYLMDAKRTESYSDADGVSENEKLQEILALVRDYDFGSAMDELSKLQDITNDTKLQELCDVCIQFLGDFNGEEAITKLEKWV